MNSSITTLCEPIVDTTTFVGSSVAFCALEGVSVTDPTGIGILLTAGANALSISIIGKIFHVDQKNSYFLKICTIITALAFSTIALPYFIEIMATSSILLTYEMAISLAVIHLITKVAFYGFYRIAKGINSYFSNVKEQNQIQIGPIIQKKEETPDIVKKVEEIAIPKTSYGFFSIASLKNRATSTVSKINKSISNCSTYAGRITQNINWKKVGVVTFIGFVILVPTVAFLASKPEQSNLISSIKQVQRQVDIIHGPCDPVSDTKSFISSKANSTLSFLPNYFLSEEVPNIIGKNTRAANDFSLKGAEFNLWDWVNSVTNKTYILGVTGIAIAAAGLSKCIAKIRNKDGSIDRGSVFQKEILTFNGIKEKMANNFMLERITISTSNYGFTNIEIKQLVFSPNSNQKNTKDSLSIKKATVFFKINEAIVQYELNIKDPEIISICNYLYSMHKRISGKSS